MYSHISSNSVNPFFSQNLIIWKREVRNFTTIFVKITFLCALRHTAAHRHFSSSQSSFSDKISLQNVQVYEFLQFQAEETKTRLQNLTTLTNLEYFSARPPRGFGDSGLTCLALMQLVTTPPERPAIMKVVYKCAKFNLFFCINILITNTPFAVHNEKIRIHLCELTTNSAKMHS